MKGQDFERKRFENLGTLTFPEKWANQLGITIRQRNRQATNFYHSRPEVLQEAISPHSELTWRYGQNLGNNIWQKSKMFNLIEKSFQANDFLIRVYILMLFNMIT